MKKYWSGLLFCSNLQHHLRRTTKEFSYAKDAGAFILSPNRKGKRLMA